MKVSASQFVRGMALAANVSLCVFLFPNPAFARDQDHPTPERLANLPQHKASNDKRPMAPLPAIEPSMRPDRLVPQLVKSVKADRRAVHADVVRNYPPPVLQQVSKKFYPLEEYTVPENQIAKVVKAGSHSRYLPTVREGNPSSQ